MSPSCDGSPIDSPCECEHNNPDSLDSRLFSFVGLAVAHAVTIDEAGATANTTKSNSRTSRESGLLCSHSHGIYVGGSYSSKEAGRTLGGDALILADLAELLHAELGQVGVLHVNLLIEAQLAHLHILLLHPRA